MFPSPEFMENMRRIQERINEETRAREDEIIEMMKPGPAIHIHITHLTINHPNEGETHATD